MRLSQDPEEKQTDAQTSPDSDQFGSFLFWRAPLPTVDDDLLELLVISRNINQ